MEKIRQIYEAEHYVLDTHTAVASVAYDKYIKDSGDKTPTVIASTASPYKFTRSVMNAIDPKYDEKSDFELVDELHRISGVTVPAPSKRSGRLRSSTIQSVRRQLWKKK